MNTEPTLKRLNCPNCGNDLNPHLPNSQTIVCDKCGTFVAIGGEQPENQGRGMPIKPNVPIELGKELTMNDTKYMVLGFVRYRGWSEAYPSESWEWDEWMVGAPDGRMLWLAHDEKGFALFTKQRIREQFNFATMKTIPYKGKQIRVHERYPAEVLGGNGELTWRAKPRERLQVVEGAGHGMRVSIQFSNEELELYTGKAINEMEIAKAFNDQSWADNINRRKEDKEIMEVGGYIAVGFAVISILWVFVLPNNDASPSCLLGYAILVGLLGLGSIIKGNATKSSL